MAERIDDIRAWRVPYDPLASVEISAIVSRDYQSGEITFVNGLSTAKAPEGGEIHPFARVSNTTAQALMDSLWECGIRPTQGSGSAGSLAATQNHLEDMRSLVAHLTTAKFK